ncbi:MAG: hypothetical protein A4E67_00552 [Syntrophaceae bacterium PtaB.Bin038]|nr:MAG: hypothetical protein A4E67_00552 [Syntrophaceae bacterium PtaB.Bin038]
MKTPAWPEGIAFFGPSMLTTICPRASLAKVTPVSAGCFGIMAAMKNLFSKPLQLTSGPKALFSNFAALSRSVEPLTWAMAPSSSIPFLFGSSSHRMERFWFRATLVLFWKRISRSKE